MEASETAEPKTAEPVAVLGKKWYKSKTVWASLISAGAIIASSSFGVEITADEAAAILLVIGLICRIVTKEPLTA
jgi:hypothetical protein